MWLRVLLTFGLLQTPFRRVPPYPLEEAPGAPAQGPPRSSFLLPSIFLLSYLLSVVKLAFTASTERGIGDGRRCLVLDVLLEVQQDVLHPPWRAEEEYGPRELCSPEEFPYRGGGVIW